MAAACDSVRLIWFCESTQRLCAVGKPLSSFIYGPWAALARYTDSNATILVKVIVVPRTDDGSHDKYSHLIGEIVSATNWQNAISQSDLKS
jgi:hypothetical protein